MRVATSVVLLFLLGTFLGCATSITQAGGQTDLADDAYEADTAILGRTAMIADMPAAAVGAAWNESATEAPFYLTQIVDPFNWHHMAWRAFYTVWSIPINPLYHVTRDTTDDWDDFVSPVRETVTYDFTPTPHGGDAMRYLASRSDSHVKHARNIGHLLKYNFLNTNSMFPPYDRWYPDQIQRDKTLIHRTFDLHLFRYDWDDPYID